MTSRRFCHFKIPFRLRQARTVPSLKRDPQENLIQGEESESLKTALETRGKTA